MVAGDDILQGGQLPSGFIEMLFKAGDAANLLI